MLHLSLSVRAEHQLAAAVKGYHDSQPPSTLEQRTLYGVPVSMHTPKTQISNCFLFTYLPIFPSIVLTAFPRRDHGRVGAYLS